MSYSKREVHMKNKEVLRIKSLREDYVHEYRSAPSNVILHRWIKDDGSLHGDGSSEWKTARRDYIKAAVSGANYEAIAWFKALGITCEAISKEISDRKRASQQTKRGRRS